MGIDSVGLFEEGGLEVPGRDASKLVDQFDILGCSILRVVGSRSLQLLYGSPSDFIDFTLVGYGDLPCASDSDSLQLL